MQTPQVPTPYPTALFIREKALVVNLESIRMIISADQVSLQPPCCCYCEHSHLAMSDHKCETKLLLLLLACPLTTVIRISRFDTSMLATAFCECLTCRVCVLWQPLAATLNLKCWALTPTKQHVSVHMCTFGPQWYAVPSLLPPTSLTTFSGKAILLVWAGVCAECTRAWAEPGGGQVPRT